ncbi:MAG: rRNA maturation RNase YbeY [Myxococcota bacterium]
MSAEVRVETDGGPDEAAIAEMADAILVALELADAELSVLLTSDAHIAELNASWRGVEGPTDVLSFPQESLPGGPRLLGDVVVGMETASRQASEQGHDLATELRVLLVHGVLHLLGHDHQTSDERAAMTKAEREVLAWVGDAPDAGLVGRSHQG